MADGAFVFFQLLDGILERRSGVVHLINDQYAPAAHQGTKVPGVSSNHCFRSTVELAVFVASSYSSSEIARMGFCAEGGRIRCNSAGQARQSTHGEKMEGRSVTSEEEVRGRFRA